MKIVKHITDLIGNTPVIELSRFGQDTGAKIIAKLEFFNPGGSVKDRIAYNMIVTRRTGWTAKTRRTDC